MGDKANNLVRIDIWEGGDNQVHIIVSQGMTWVAGNTYDITVGAFGNKYAVWVNSMLKIAWTADTGNHFLTATGVGYGVRGRNITTGWDVIRFDNVATHPHTITIPASLTVGKVPDVLTGGSTLGSDVFTDTNGVRLNAHTAGAGGAWTEHTGTWTVQSNRATVVVATGLNFATQNLGVTNVECSVDLVTPGSFPTDYLISGIAARYVDDNNYIAIRTVMSPAQVGQDEIELHELIGGAGGVVKKVNLANYYAVGVTYALKVQCKGDLIQVFLDGVPRLSYYTQAGSPLGTRFGLVQHNLDDGVVFDNWTVKAL
jgi:hypothetical protein